jgi:hypothetical protein
MANKLGEAKLFFVPYFLWTLICIFVVRSKILSRIVCDPKHDKCDETLDEVTRPYMAGINNRRFIWSEYSMVGITLLPCLTVPYMLAEFLRTKRIRSFGLFESIADEAIVLLNTWKFIFVFAMAMLIERGTGTWTISKAVVFGEKSVVIYRPFTNAMRSVQMAVKPQCTKHDLDLDIAGPGVRLSTYLLLAITNMSLTMGSFHGGITGTKELGICTLLSRFSFSQAYGKSITLTISRPLRNGIQPLEAEEELSFTYGDIPYHRSHGCPDCQPCRNSFLKRRSSIKVVRPAQDRLRNRGMAICARLWTQPRKLGALCGGFCLLYVDQRVVFGNRQREPGQLFILIARWWKGVRLSHAPCNCLPVLLVQSRRRSRAHALASPSSHDSIRFIGKAEYSARHPPRLNQLGYFCFDSCYCFRKLDELFLPPALGHNCYRETPHSRRPNEVGRVASLGPVSHACSLHWRSIALVLREQGADIVHLHVGIPWGMAKYTVHASYRHRSICCNGFEEAVFR